RFAGRRMVLSGTSAGAVNAALIAAGRSPDEMMRFWDELAADLPVAVTSRIIESVVRTVAKLTLNESQNWSGALRAWGYFVRRAWERFPPWPGRLLGTGLEYLLTDRFDLLSDFVDDLVTPSLVDTARLRDRLVHALGERMRTDVHDLAISAVDVGTRKVVRFVSRGCAVRESAEYVVPDGGITVDMLLASASIPVLFPPAKVGTRLFWDGGLLGNTPLAPVVALGATEIVTVLVTELAQHASALERLGGALERAVDTLLESSYESDRKLLL